MTYEQSKYMNGDENANASFAPKAKPQPQGGNNLTYEQSKYNDEYQKRNNVAQEGLKARQDQILSKRPGDGSQDTKNGFADTMKKGWDTVKGWFNPQESNQSQTVSYLPETMGDEEKSLYQNVASNDVDSDTKLQEQGQNMKKAIESVVPRYDKKTWKSLMTDPNMSWDQKAELVMNSLGGALSAGDTGQVQQTDKRVINDAITQQYAENIADRDRRAMNAAIEPIEALNKQKTDAELRLRDTVVGAYIDRYNAEQSAETKKKILEALIKDKGTWATLDEQQKMDTLAYIQALDGDGSLMAMALQEFGPDFLKWLKSITKGNGENVSGEETSGEEPPSDKFRLSPNRKLTDAQLEEDQNLEEKKRKYVVIPGVGGKPPLVVRKGDRVWDADNETKERELAVNAILENYSLSPEDKIKYARLCDGNIPGENLGDIGLIEWAVRRGIKNTPSTGVPPEEQEKRKANAQTVQTEINNIQSQVTSGSMTPSDAIKKIDALASKMENMDDGTGLIALKAQNLMRDYVVQDIKGNVENDARNPLKNASASLQSLERMVQQYGDKIAQDPKLREKVDNMYTKYRYQENYIDPFMKNVGQDVLKTGGNSVGGVEMPSGSWVIGSDGQIWDINPYNLSGKYKPIDFATYQWDTNKNAKATAITALTSVYDKANPETVKKNMGSVPIEGQGEVFRETPVFKFMENLVKDENFKNKAYAVNKSGAFIHPDMKSMYDKINGRYLMWKNK
jgi:hypothetical protein